jgi:crossover junction endodeoxyribonuclease RuvC
MTLDVILGLDPSLTSTGICYGTGPDDWQSLAVVSKARGEDVLSRVKRCEFVVEQIERILVTVKPRLILIEDYAFASKYGKPAYRAELGGLIRWHCIEYTPHILEVAPTSLKKFATGKGAGDKSLIQAHVQRRWGQMFETDDECDAFCLYQMALCISGRQKPETQPQRDAVKTVVSGHPSTAQQIIEFCNAVERN